MLRKKLRVGWGGVMITFLEMHVWLGVSHRCFQKAFVATLTHVLQEEKSDCHVVRAPDSLQITMESHFR